MKAKIAFQHFAHAQSIAITVENASQTMHNWSKAQESIAWDINLITDLHAWWVIDLTILEDANSRQAVGLNLYLSTLKSCEYFQTSVPKQEHTCRSERKHASSTSRSA